MSGISFALSFAWSSLLAVAPLPDGPDRPDAPVNSASTARQCNASLAVDPTDPLHWLGAADDYRNVDANGSNTCVYYTTFDGGQTWIENTFSNPDAYYYCSKAGVAFGPNGEPYFLARGAGSTDYDTRLFVATSSDGGATIGSWVHCTPRDATSGDLDPRIVVDPGPGARVGTIYVCYTHESTTRYTFISSSKDGGVHWGPHTFLSDSNDVLGSDPLVGTNSEVYFAYYDFTDSSIKFATSTDGARTFGVDVKICDAVYLNVVPHTTFQTNSYPFLAIDRTAGPYAGYIYCCFASDAQTGSGADVFVCTSSDGGLTWSAPQRVNDDTTSNAQFFPSIEVDANGRVNVGFYDRRDDPGDVKPRYYVARSLDGGATWQKNVPAADVSFDPTRYPQGSLIGNLTAVATADHDLHAMWTDGRNLDDDVFQSTLELDLFTDVATLSAANGGTANFTLDAGPLHQGDDYRLLGSVTGTTPGLTLHGVNVPVNYDAFTLLTIAAANGTAFPNFAGVLSAKGDASAALVAPPIPPALIGLQMDFAFLVRSAGKVEWASTATRLQVVP